MEVLFTGAGSIGARHIKNLTKVCRGKNIELQIDVIRKSQRPLTDEVRAYIRNEIREDMQLADHYDILFVTDETGTHFENMCKFRDRCQHMFIEKPIFDRISYPVENVMPKDDAVYYVAAPIRFTKYFQKVKECVRTHEIYAARIIFSSYMPQWQSGRDYRKSFRCFADRGGGVDIDSLHEIDYMLALFGQPESVQRSAGKYSGLKMQACDLAAYIFRYPDKLVEMHLDYFGRVNNRRIEMFAKDDVIVVDFNKQSVEKQLSGEVVGYGPEEDFYGKEMSYFVEMVLSKKKEVNINTVENAFTALKLAKGTIG